MAHDTASLAGRCLCGAVTFTAEIEGDEVGARHCAICRRHASGPMFAALGVRRVEFTGERDLARYRSSAAVERGVCGTCGTKLFFRVVETDTYHLNPGAFDDQARWHFAEQIFIDSKPAFYAFANATRTMTGAEFRAAYAGATGGQSQ